MLWINYELYLQKILDASPDNYRALVFLGKSAEGLNQSDHALKAYRQAIDVSPDEILAWQGLNKLYEKYPPTQTKDHTEVLEKLVKLTTRYLLPFYASCDSDWFLSTIKMVSNVYHLFYFNCICFFLCWQRWSEEGGKYLPAGITPCDLLQLWWKGTFSAVLVQTLLLVYPSGLCILYNLILSLHTLCNTIIHTIVCLLTCMYMRWVCITRLSVCVISANTNLINILTGAKRCERINQQNKQWREEELGAAFPSSVL